MDTLYIKIRIDNVDMSNSNNMFKIIVIECLKFSILLIFMIELFGPLDNNESF